jgi:serine/threonine protein kinase
VTEYVNGGYLDDLIKKHRGQMPSHLLLSILLQIYSSLSYLKQNHIIHQDLKPKTILLTDQYVIKLCDFGFSEVIPEGQSGTTAQCGTPNYSPPELFSTEKKYTFESEICSLGCIIYEMFFGVLVFNGDFSSMSTIFRARFHKFQITFFQNYSKTFSKKIESNAQQSSFFIF